MYNKFVLQHAYRVVVDLYGATTRRLVATEILLVDDFGGDHLLIPYLRRSLEPNQPTLDVDRKFAKILNLKFEMNSLLLHAKN